MLTEFFTIGLLILLSAMLPGPDFALVAKNTLLHSRRAGFFTALGISSAILIHVTYCILGLAVVISESALLFNIIKFVGAIYLIYLGISSLLTKHQTSTNNSPQNISTKISMPDRVAYRQGFFCNLLNPKATLFFLALFTVIIKPETALQLKLIYAAELFVITATWFGVLTILLSHPTVMRSFQNVEKYLAKLLGLFLIGFGIGLAFLTK